MDNKTQKNRKKESRILEGFRALYDDSVEGVWCFDCNSIPVQTPAEQVVDLLFQGSRLLECNDEMAKQYGHNTREDIIGIELHQLLDPTELNNREFLRSFIRNDFKMKDGISIEYDVHGDRHYFNNNFTGIIEDGNLVRAWGNQSDITEKKMAQAVNSALYQISSAIYTTNNSGNFFERLHEILEKIISIENIHIVLFDDRLSKFSIPYKSFDSQMSVPDPAQENSLEQMLFKQKKQILLNRNEIKSRIKTGSVYSIQEIPELWFGLPLDDGSKVIGTVILQYYQPDYKFHKWDLDILNRLRQQIGLAVAHKTRVQHLYALFNIVNQASDTILITDKDGIIQYVNPSFSELSGYDPEEVIGKRPEIFHADGRGKKIYRDLWQQIQSGNSFKDEILHTTRSGDLYYHDLVITPIKNDRGAIKHYLSTGRDVTRRHEQKELLRYNEKKFRSIFELASEAICILEEGQIVDGNEEAFELFEGEKEQIIGRYLHEFSFRSSTNGRQSKHNLEQKVELALSGKKQKFEWQGKTLLGVKFDAEISLSRLGTFGEKFLQAIIRDVSEKKRLQEAKDAILKVSQSAQTVDSLDELYRVIHESLKQLLPADNFYIALANKKTGELSLPYFLDTYDEMPDEELLKGGITEYVYRKGKPFLMSGGNLKEFARQGKFTIKGKIPIDWLGIPLEVGKKPIGVLVVQSYTLGVRYTENEVELLQFVSEQIAGVLAKKYAQQEADEEHQMLSVMLRSIGDGVVTTDIAGNIVLFNHKAEELTGWDAKDARGERLFEVLNVQAERTGQGALTDFQEIIHNDEFEKIPFYDLLFSKNGDKYNIVTSFAPLYDDNSDVTGAVVTFHNITEVRELEAEVLKSKALQSVSRVTGGIAHDFNNILAGILGNISLARIIGNDFARMNELLRKAEFRTKSATRLTTQMLFSIQNNYLELQELDISKLVHNALQDILGSEHINTHLRAEEKLWPVYADKIQIKKAVRSIFQKIKGIPEEERNVKIYLKNVFILPNQRKKNLRSGPYIVIRIISNQVNGQPAELRSTQNKNSSDNTASSSNSQNNNSQTIFEKHNGGVITRTTPDGKTVMSLYLPAIPEKMMSEEGDKEIANLSEIPKGTESILIMEENSEVRASMVSMLEELGYSVTAVSDGEEAAHEYAKQYDAGLPYDLVILDLTVNRGEGAEKTIKKLKFLDPKVKSIISSGYSIDPILSEYELYGFVDKVRKPFDISELAIKIRKILDTIND